MVLVVSMSVKNKKYSYENFWHRYCNKNNGCKKMQINFADKNKSIIFAVEKFNPKFCAMTILDFLKSVKGCQFMTIAYAVEPKMNKRGNPYFGKVTKITVAQVQYGYSYENAVNNRTAENAPEFKAQAMSGAEWLDGYENRLCVSAKGIRARFYRYEGGKSKSVFLIDGRLATDAEVAEIKAFMPQRKPSQTQASVGLIEHQVEPFAIYVDNIISIKGAGQVVNCNSPMLAYCGE